jgi:hypothetical protein
LKKEKKYKNNTQKIGYLEISGTLNFHSDKEPQINPLTTLIGNLSKTKQYKGKKDGYHTFTGGQISSLYEISNAMKVELTVKFKSARPSFMDKLVDNTLSQSDECNMSFSLRGLGINFESLREYVGLEEKAFSIQSFHYDNFEGFLPLDKTKIKIAAYPGASLVNILANFNKNSLKPSKIIRKIFKKVILT